MIRASTGPPAKPAGRCRPWTIAWFVAPPICVAASVWVVTSLDLAAVSRVARQADARWLILAALAVIVRFLVWGIKFARMLRRSGPSSYSASVRGVVAGAFLNLITPTAKLAGGVLRAAEVRRRTGWRFSSSYGWIVADQLTNAFGNLLLYGVLSVLAAIALENGLQRAVLSVSGAGALGLIAAFVSGRDRVWNLVRRPGVRHVLSRWRLRRTTLSDRDPDRREWHEAWLSPVLENADGPRALCGDIVLSAVSWSFLCLGNVMVFRAIGVDAPVFQVATALVVGTFLGAFVGMGGIGVTEATLVGLYTQIGVEPATAAAAALLHRASYYLVVLIWGGWAFTRIGTPFRGNDPRFSPDKETCTTAETRS